MRMEVMLLGQQCQYFGFVYLKIGPIEWEMLNSCGD